MSADVQLKPAPLSTLLRREILATASLIYMVKYIEGHQLDDKAAIQVAHERVLDCLNVCVREVARLVRLDELERIQSATLDADQDVWSTTNDGQIISLTDRIKALAVLNTVPGQSVM